MHFDIYLFKKKATIKRILLGAMVLFLGLDGYAMEEIIGQHKPSSASGVTDTAVVTSTEDRPIFEIERSGKSQKITKVSTKKNGINFVLEKQTFDNMLKWSQFTRKQFEMFNEYKERERGNPDNLLSGILPTDALVPFRNVVIDTWTPVEEVWISHATPEGESEVEGCMTVSAKTGFPVIADVGIFRTMEYMLNPDKKQTRGLAEQLHLFTSAAIQEPYPDLHYIYTAPIQIMKKIMLAKREKLGLLWYVYESKDIPPFIPPRINPNFYKITIMIDGEPREYDTPAFMNQPPLLVGEQMIFDINRMKNQFLNG